MVVLYSMETRGEYTVTSKHLSWDKGWNRSRQKNKPGTRK